MTEYVPGAAAYNLFVKLGLFKDRKRRQYLARAFGVSPEIFDLLNIRDRVKGAHDVYHRLIMGEGSIGDNRKKLMELTINGKVDPASNRPILRGRPTSHEDLLFYMNVYDIEHGLLPPPSPFNPYLAVARDFFEWLEREHIPHLLSLGKKTRGIEKLLKELVKQYYAQRPSRIALILGKQPFFTEFYRNMRHVIAGKIRALHHPTVYRVIDTIAKGISITPVELGTFKNLTIYSSHKEPEKAFSTSFWYTTGYCPVCGRPTKGTCSTCGWKPSTPTALPLEFKITIPGHRPSKNDPNSPVGVITVNVPGTNEKTKVLTVNPYHPLVRYIIEGLKNGDIVAEHRGGKIHYRVNRS